MRLAKLLSVFFVFLIIIYIALNVQEMQLKKSHRFGVASNVDKIKFINEKLPNVKGDYLYNFNSEANTYNVIPLYDNLTIIDEANKEYGNLKEYKKDSYSNYISLLEKELNVEKLDYFNFSDNSTNTNVGSKQKTYYENSIQEMIDFYNAIKENKVDYRVQDNNRWLRLEEEYEYDSGDITNEKINDDFVSKIKDDEDLEKNVFLSFFQPQEITLECKENKCVYNEKEMKESLKILNHDHEDYIKYDPEIKSDYTFINDDK